MSIFGNALVGFPVYGTSDDLLVAYDGSTASVQAVFESRLSVPNVFGPAS